MKATDDSSDVIPILSRIRFELDDWQFAVRPGGWKRPLSLFGDYHFWWIEEGKGTITIDDLEHRVQGGELLLIRPGNRVSARVDAGKNVRAFFIPFMPLEEHLWDSLIVSTFTPKIPGELAALFHEAFARHTELHKKSHSTLLCRKTFFFRFLETMAVHGFITRRPKNAGSRQYIHLERLTNFLEKRLSETISLEILAREVGLDRTTVIRLFKRFLKTTPARWQMERRLEKGRELLLSSHPVAVVAEKVGFAGASGFSRAFKARYNLSPELYIKNKGIS